MFSSTSKTALIAGSGLAGLAAAVLLDERGYKVTLVERKPLLGGRTVSFADHVTKVPVDNGQHLLIGAYHHTFDLLKRVGASHKLDMMKPTHVPLMNKQGKLVTLKIGTAKPPFNLLWGLICFRGLSFSDKLRLASLIRPIGHIKNSAQTVLNFLQQHHQSQHAIENFWEPLALATLNDKPENTTIDGLWQLIHKAYFAGRDDGFLVFPKEDLSQVFVEPIRRFLDAKGCQIITGLGLKHIHSTSDRITAFEMQDGSQLAADLFISALPPWDLCRVLPEHLRNHHTELKHVKDMTGSPVVAVDLFFDHPVMQERFVGLTKAKTHWIFNHSFSVSTEQCSVLNQRTGQCPVPTCFHISTITSAAHDLMNESRQNILNMALHDLSRIVGVQNLEPQHALVHKTQNATLSSLPGINERRPQQKIANNFFVIGDWTKTNLPATIESAVRSAFMMRDCLP